MPTGYTSSIEKGVTFEQFVWQCARGMGALIMMRDSPWDAPIPERFEPSDYHIKEIKEAHSRVAELEAIPDEKAALAATADYQAEMQQHNERIQKKYDLRGKYKAMLDKVRDWHPPSPDHEGFKSFMDEQISSSIDFDCSTSYMTPPKHLNGTDWRASQLEEARRKLAYHTEENAKEIERAESRNRWLRELRVSVPPPHPSTAP